MSWLAIALIACCAQCIAVELNRRSRLNGYEVLLYRCLLAGFILLPFTMYMHIPHDPRFYVMIGISSFIYAYGNIVMINLAIRKGGRVAMMYQPLMIFTTFLLWLLISPQQLAELNANPSQWQLSAVCFGILVVSLHFVRRNDYAWKSFLMIVPIAIGYACLSVAQKWFLGTTHGGMGMILAILLFGNLGMVMVLPFLSRFRVRSDELAIERRADFPALTLIILACLHLISWGGMMHAMDLAANPAYPVAIYALTPVFFQVYYWVRGWHDQASPVAGSAMALSAFALAIVNT